MKIVGQLLCGPGEADKYLEETLKEFKRLCDDVVVASCFATKKDVDLIKSYDFRHYYDNREWGRFQPQIKTKLLATIKLLKPDWVLVLDADETVPTVDRSELERLAEGREACQFYVVNLWNDILHYSRALSFWNVRFYKPFASSDTQYLRKPVHCGNAPPYFYALKAKDTYVPHILLHKGLMEPAVRRQKAERYAKYDPDAIHKGREYYDALVAEGTGTEYTQDEVIARITEYYAKLHRGKS